MARQDARSVAQEINQPGVGPMLASTSPLRWNRELIPPQAAPTFGPYTEEVLSETLALSQIEIGRLSAAGVISMAASSPEGRA